MSVSVYISLPKEEMRKVVEAAQAVLRDERHWSLTDCADRAAAGEDLAAMILDLLGEDVAACPSPCGECQAHRANCGEVEA